MGLVAGAVTVAGVVAHHARHRAPYRPRREVITLQSPPSQDLTGLKIGFLTDTHVGPMVDPELVDTALALLFEARPDVLCLGGDFVCDSPRFIPEMAAVLGPYARYARLGTFAVLGNHDIATDAVRLVSHLERQGVHVLRNESTAVEDDSRRLWIAGIDDALLGQPDLERTFSGVPDGAATLALWHEPDWAERVTGYGAFLQLSGHSHGGQIRLPLVGHISAPSGGKRFVHGLNDAAGMPVYTSRGLGVYHPPVRFRCPPEVTLVTFQK